MMKKIFALVFLLVLGKISYSQYPLVQNLGSDSTIVVSKGATQSRFVNVTYVDTAAANLQRIRQYPGAQIVTTGSGSTIMWIRNTTATGWLRLPAGTATGNIYTIDGTLTGTRNLSGSGFPLTFSGLDKFVVSGDSIRFTAGNQSFALNTDSGSITKKLSYSGNYSGDFKQYTLVDKNYVDSVVTSSPAGTVTSVGLTMPIAFNVSGSPVTSAGTLSVTAAGVASQYIRGDGQLATLPTTGGGGSSVSYYLNGSVNQGTFGGDTYYQMNKTPVLGAGTDFTISSNGYIASFITDAGDPDLLNIPAGNWDFEIYFQSSSSSGTPSFYVELYKYNGTTFTLIASSSTNPKFITGGTNVDAYYTPLAVPATTLAITDRLAIRVYVNNSGNTITLHTEDNNLCQVITTFSTGINALNGLTDQVQYFAVGTSGTDFNISSLTDTHTFNLPTASATNRGALSSADWTTFNGKVGGSGTSGQVSYFNGTNSITGSNNLFWDNANSRLGVGGSPGAFTLDINGTARVQGNTTIVGDLSVPSGNYMSVNGTGSIFGMRIQSSLLNITAGNTNLAAFDQSLASGALSLRGVVNNNISGNFSQLQVGSTTTAALTSNAGTANYTAVNITSSYNITGGTHNIIGIYYDPTLTSMTGVTHRAIQTVSGNVIFGSTSGNVLIGTTTDAGFRLDVNGTARVQGTFTAANGIWDATGIAVNNIRRLSGTLTFNSDGGTLNSMQFTATSAWAAISSGTVRHMYNDAGFAGSGTSNFSHLSFTGTSNTSTTGNLTYIDINPNITTTNAASTVRGIFYNPAFTSIAGAHRAIQTVSGDVLFGTTSGNVAIGGGTSPAAKLEVSGSITAASAIARGVNFTNTLVAAANNDVLVGLDINPTFTNGAFTGVSNIGLRVNNGYLTSYNGITTYSIAAANIYAPFINNISRSDALASYTFASYSALGIGFTATDIALGFFNSGLRMKLFATGNLSIGTTTDAGFRLDVNGTARVQGEITVNGTGTNTIDRITITRSGSDAQISATGGGFLRLNAPRVNIIQNVLTSNTIASGSSNLILHTGIDNATPLDIIFRTSNASTELGRFVSVGTFLTSASVTAASAIARGINVNNTLVAAANNDVLVGLDINPTFTNGAFTGVSNLALRILQSTGNTGSNILRLANNSGNANVIQFWSTNTATPQSSIISTNSTFGYGTYVANQLNLLGGTGGVALRTNNSAPIRFYATNADIDLSTVQMQMFAATGNVTLQNGGTFTDAGFRLDVNGTARVQGQLSVGNTTTTGIIRAGGDVALQLMAGQATDVFQFSQMNSGVFPTGGSTEQSLVRLTIGQNTSTPNNSIGSVIRMLGTLANTAATNVYNNIQTNTTINNTGGTTTYRGFYHNPTLTNLTGTTHRAIETVSGDVVFGSTSGNVMIGTTTAGGRFTIQPTNDQVGMAISGSSLTGSNAQSLVSLSQTWNTTGNPTAFLLNITNTASGATADLMELQVGGVAQFIVGKTGSGYFKDMLTIEPQTANTGAIKTDGYSLTGSNAQSLLSMTGTWNTTGNPTAIKLDITNTASGANSYLMDLQVGSATQFRVTKAGAIRTAAPTTGTANDWKLGSVVGGTTVLDTTQWLEVEVGGTLYRVALVTLPEPEPGATPASTPEDRKISAPVKTSSQRIQELENEIQELRKMINFLMPTSKNKE